VSSAIRSRWDLCQRARRYNQAAIRLAREGRDRALDLAGVAHVDRSLSPRRDRKPAAVTDARPHVSLELQSLLPDPNSWTSTSPHP
jgi:hypothetical protein